MAKTIRAGGAKMDMYRNARIQKENKNKFPPFPKCKGTLDICPRAIEDFKNPPESCRKCSTFIESKYYKPNIDKERIVLFKKLLDK